MYGQTEQTSILGVSKAIQLVKLFLQIIYIAAFGFEFCDSILTKKIHCTNHEVQAANGNK